ncbi:MAG: saccharopine dehydrogenase family protein [Fidelibacterota bacterium]|jgi:short subunit dehydrogenase-like uncharacterized protein|tara:strand:- start:758 stop:1999 length:1242 start_codon:yes stop_codon:yes gene_type:complete
MKKIKYDLIVMGATGFTGKLVIEYLIQNYGVHNKQFSWAIAGRNQEKLNDVKASFYNLDPHVKEIPTFIADSHNSKLLDEMTSICRLVISTVGPYLKYGLLLVESCVKNGTDYCDLTGEVPFIRQSIDLFHKKAKMNQCRIIHSCGFDSIPSDIGVLMLQNDSIQKNDKPYGKIDLYVKSIGGGFSGGTIESMINISRYIDSKPQLKNILSNPFALNPKEHMKNSTHQSSLKTIKWSKKINRWVCPFIMSGINTRIVRRSNAINNFFYGEGFKYSEVYSFKKGIKGLLSAFIMFLGLIILKISISFSPFLWVLRKFYFPQPGDGPSKKDRENGFFKLVLVGYINDSKNKSLIITGDRDPGYGATAKMITESALSILLEPESIPQNYGVLTPATGIGMILVDRLKNKGIKFNLK